MDIKGLEKKIQEGKINEAVDIIDDIGRKKLKETEPYLIKELERTDNHILRNSIALALSDMESEGAIKPIMNLLNDNKTKGHRGTLLYALESLNFLPYIESIIEL